MPNTIVNNSQTLSVRIADAGEVYLPLNVTGEIKDGDTVGEIRILLEDPHNYNELITAGEEVYVVQLGEHPVLRVDGQSSTSLSCLRCETDSHLAHGRTESMSLHGMYMENPCDVTTQTS